MFLKELLLNKYFITHKYEFVLILQKVLNLSKEDIYIKNIKISDYQLKRIKKLYDEFAINHRPIEYILQKVEFMGQEFLVNENVLIPRPETEYLVKYALNYKDKIDIFFDIGTGSGIIGIMLAKLTGKEVICSDISERALQVAKYNALNLCKNCNIEFVKSNLIDHINQYKGNKLICANLPYVDFKHKLDHYTKFEPKIALFAKENGLKLYKDLLKQLDKKVLFAFELTNVQADTLLKQFNLNAQKLETCHKNIKILLGYKS